MNEDKYRVLILDDDYELGELLQEYLENTHQCAVDYVSSVEEFWSCLKQENFDILFLDYKLPTANGLDILGRMNEAGYTVPTVMMTGEGSESIAARAIQAGALDYLVKGEYAFSSLPPLINKAVRLREMQRAMQQYLEQIRYQALLLDNMRDAVVVWGLDGKITYWNTAAEQLYGAPAFERLGEPVESIYFPCFEPPICSSDLDAAANLQIEHRYQANDQEKIWISTHITRLFNEGSPNEPIGYMNVARDITPRKREQEALIQSRHFVQRILDTSPNIIYILDLHSRQVIYVNPEIKAILGDEVEEFTNSTYDAFIERMHPQDRARMAQHILDLQTLQDGEVREAEFRVVNRSRELRWLKSRETVFFRSQNGPPGEIIGVIQDITASKLAEEKLRESEARYRAIVEDHQTEMICRFLPNATLTFVNEAYCRYYGLDRSSLVGTSFLEPIADEDQPATRERLEDLNQERPVQVFEQRVRLPNGETRWQEWVSRAIFDQRLGFIEYQAVGRDITERKRMEEQVKVAQTRLTQAARLSSIGELASGVAHQISNPLTTIIADAQLLKNELGSQHPGHDSADAIYQAGWRAQRVINELMKFAQPTQAASELVQINETIQAALLLASAHIQASGVDLQIHLQADLPAVSGNPRQLTDLWVNLLLLARSAFTGDQAHTIRITTRRLRPGTVQVEVADDGAPIPDTQMDTLFEPQLIPTGSGRGTGIEMSLCREIVRQNRGQISVSSSQTETRVQITFSSEES